MRETPNRVAIDRVDWANALPVVRLASALRLALQPDKLVVALLAVVLIHFSGLILGEVFAGGEEDRSAADVAEAVLMDRAGEPNPYEKLVFSQRLAFAQLFGSALALDHGLGQGEAGVADALHLMFVAIPAGSFDDSPWFTVLFGADVLFVLLIAGGMITRMAATQVCLDKLTSLKQSMRFVSKRWAWYLLAPLIPAGFVLFVGGLLILAGLALFNAPGLDVAGSVLYGLLLLGGFVIALVTFALLFALFLMSPVISVEGTDAFDAIARSFNYVLFKPWQFAGYLIASVVYLAVVSVLVGTLAGLTLKATYSFVDVGAIAEVELKQPGAADEQGVTNESPAVSVPRHDAIMLDAHGDVSQGGTVDISGWIVARWFELLAALVAAVVLSTLFSLQTQVYVLLRRCADGAPFEHCAQDDERQRWSSPADMVDPVAQELAAQSAYGQPAPDAEPAADGNDAADSDGKTGG